MNLLEDKLLIFKETEQELERRTVEVEHLEGLLNSTRVYVFQFLEVRMKLLSFI